MSVCPFDSVVTSSIKGKRYYDSYSVSIYELLVISLVSLYESVLYYIGVIYFLLQDLLPLGKNSVPSFGDFSFRNVHRHVETSRF